MKTIKGIPGAPGIAQGPVVLYKKSAGSGETLDLQTAVQQCLKQVQMLYEKTLHEVGEEQAKIFSAYEMLLEDPMLLMPIEDAIASGTDSRTAVLEETRKMSEILATKGGEYMRQRADDIRYIGEMLAQAVSGEQNSYALPEGTTPFLLAAHELTPVDTMQFDSARLAGLITELGGATSHTVILAKSLGIPAVVGAKGIVEALSGGESAFLDGYTGEFVASPDERTKVGFEKKLYEDQQLQKQIATIKDDVTHTLDGQRVAVCINIGRPQDLKGADEMQYDGVGLFRSEFLYSSEQEKPTLNQQETAYRQAIEAAAPNVVIIRTLDIGGDKQLAYLNMPLEENPFLGNRGIRLCLQNKPIFAEQLEAILRAAAGNRVKIMLPMVTSVREIAQAKEILEEVKQKLYAQEIPYCEDVQLGIMIETPASAIMAEQFAKHCDFFSIGTNDLVQYIMSADRGNAQVQQNYDPCHPAVAHMLAKVIHAGVQAGIEVSVCGDLAADLRFTKLLLGFGLKKFSVPLPMVGRIKFKIRSIDEKDARELAERVLAAADEDEVRKILEED